MGVEIAVCAHMCIIAVLSTVTSVACDCCVSLHDCSVHTCLSLQCCCICTHLYHCGVTVTHRCIIAACFRDAGSQVAEKAAAAAAATGGGSGGCSPCVEHRHPSQLGQHVSHYHGRVQE